MLDVFHLANNNIFIRKMEFLDAVFPDETYYTEFGELRFYENPKPKFAFYNQKAKKSEIVCYSSTIRAVANCLPEAQAVARAYIAGKKTEPNPEEKREEPAVPFANPPLSEKSETEAEAAAKEDYIFCKLVSQYGKEILIKNNLQVSLYMEQPKIWLKPWWRNADEPGTAWFPSNSGFQFSLFDSARNMVAFADRCLAEASKKHFGAKDKSNPWKPTPSPPVELETAFVDWIDGKNPEAAAEFEALLKEAEVIDAANATETAAETKKVSGSRKRKMRN